MGHSSIRYWGSIADFVIVVISATAAAFAALWYLGREPLRQRVREYDTKLHELETSRDAVIAEARTNAGRIADEIQTRKRMAEEETKAVRDSLDAERAGLDR